MGREQRSFVDVPLQRSSSRKKKCISAKGKKVDYGRRIQGLVNCKCRETIIKNNNINNDNNNNNNNNMPYNVSLSVQFNTSS